MDSSRPTLLLVEDDPDDLALFERALRRAALGHVLTTAHSLEAAVARVATADAVLCDLNLPDSRGLETVDALRAVAPDVPLIVLTGVDDEALALEALRRGAHDYLFKNELEPRRLSRSVLYAIERAHHECTRKAHEAALRELDRNHFVEQLAGEVIGELSNILTRQMVLAELVEDVRELDAARPHLRDIAETTRQASSLVADLRSFLPSGGASTRIELGAFVARVEAELRLALPDGVELVVEPGDGHTLASEHILHNLVTRLVTDIAQREPSAGVIELAVERGDGNGADASTSPWISLVARHRRQDADLATAPFTGLSLDEVIERAPRVIPRGARLRLRASQAELARLGGALDISANGCELTLRAVLPAAEALT